MLRKKIIPIFVSIVLLLSIIAFKNQSFGANTASGSSSIVLPPNIGCNVTSINWGTIQQGGSASSIIAIFPTTGTVDVVTGLGFAITNASPANLTQSLKLTWNYSGFIKPKLSRAIMFTLKDSTYTGSFSFDIVINATWTIMGDIGGGILPQYYQFDGLCDGKDLALFLQCYKGIAPANAMYLADLGSLVNGVPTFFAYDGVVNGADLALFLDCYHSEGP